MALENISEITIYEVEKLKNIFLELLKEDKIILNMKGITKIDIVGIQLLISFLKSAEALGKDVKFENISESVHEQIASSSCENALGLV